MQPDNNTCLTNITDLAQGLESPLVDRDRSEGRLGKRYTSITSKRSGHFGPIGMRKHAVLKLNLSRQKSNSAQDMTVHASQVAAAALYQGVQSYSDAMEQKVTGQGIQYSVSSSGHPKPGHPKPLTPKSTQNTLTLTSDGNSGSSG